MRYNDGKDYKRERMVSLITSKKVKVGGISEKFLKIKDETINDRTLNYISQIVPNDLFVYDCNIDELNEERPCSQGVSLWNSLHFVLNGKGKFICDGVEYTVEKNSCFVLLADKYNKIRVDEDEKLTYLYIDISGLLQANIIRHLGISNINCVLKLNDYVSIKNKFLETYNASLDTSLTSLRTTSALYSLLVELETLLVKKSKFNNNKEIYIKQALGYIKNHLGKTNVNVKELATALSVSPEYLTRVCKDVLNVSIKELIVVIKMQRACNMLKYSSEPINKISRDLGYKQQKYFSKVFKGLFGVSPTDYRNKGI